jgi:hypothetical protein
MTRVARTDDRLYMRGTDAAQFIHVTELGDPKFVGLGWEASSLGVRRLIARAR